MSYAHSPRRTVLADALVTNRTLVTDMALIAAGVVVVALLAQVEIPMFPVPITGQTLGVVVVGAALGARRGAMSMTAYLLLGLSGVPIFAGFAAGLSPSFGFIIGFIPAAAAAGWFAERRWDRTLGRAFLSFASVSVLPFLFGVPFVMLFLSAVLGTPQTFGEAIATSVLPFIPGGLIKAALAAVFLPLAWRGVRALDARAK